MGWFSARSQKEKEAWSSVRKIMRPFVSVLVAFRCEWNQPPGGLVTTHVADLYLQSLQFVYLGWGLEAAFQTHPWVLLLLVEELHFESHLFHYITVVKHSQQPSASVLYDECKLGPQSYNADRGRTLSNHGCNKKYGENTSTACMFS